MFKSNNKDTRVSLLLTLNILTPCSIVSIVNFERVITGWVRRSDQSPRLDHELL